MTETISVTSNLPLGVKVSDDLTVMPGVTNVDAGAWRAWAATKPSLIENGDVVETTSLKPPKDEGKTEGPVAKLALPAPGPAATSAK